MIALVLLALALVAYPAQRAPVHRVVVESDAAEDVPAESGDDGALEFAAGLDVFAACLRAGLPVATAARAAVPAAPPVLAGVLREAADLLALGADAELAWAAAARVSATEGLARAVRRSARSGAALSGAVTELSTEARAAAEDGAAAAAERAGVLIAGPLGLCFLPAFVCLGIVPVVVGLAGTVLGDGLL
ncbi:type II secretion system F family protein [Rhodococcus rhodnii]|uniref:Type II secretion system protein GspF domain-containing protein n=2 Tax=Rhodococcus rhodnii TaxID=38312 RepID=R7WI21_9NOCA|nr:type II secretion system F family protein [Rhodococcus rhodnii]EOM74800.1 hypothetical protein Rrhod_3881 [Rhodococcus rhodnii LMG 5362]TXG89307.1 type II secretion system F family protein [Rhodococcus rhodnii]